MNKHNKLVLTIALILIILGILINNDNSVVKHTIVCDNHELTGTCVIIDSQGNSILDLSVVEAEEEHLFVYKNLEKYVKENVK